jgi:hypothetical protein
MIETMDADFSVIAMSFSQIIMHYLHPLSEADVVTGEYGSCILPFTIEVMVRCFVSDTSRIITVTILVLFVFVWLELTQEVTFKSILVEFLCNFGLRSLQDELRSSQIVN